MFIVKENFKVNKNNLKLEINLDNFREPERATKERKLFLLREN